MTKRDVIAEIDENDLPPWNLEPDIPAAKSKRGQGAFAKNLPNSFSRDERVSEVPLVLGAFRATFIGRFGLNEKALQARPIVKPNTGFGVNAIRKGIADLVDLGYLEREQLPPGPDGQFRRAIDRLRLPPCGKSGRAGNHVKRAWFDGTLSLKAMAAFLFIRAGTGKGPSVYCRDLCKRFGWSRPTTNAVLKELRQFGLVREHQHRDQGSGRFGGNSYSKTTADQWAIWTAVKKPCNGSPCNGNPCNLLTFGNPSHGLPTEEPLPQTHRESYIAAPPATDLSLDAEPDSIGHVEIDDELWKNFAHPSDAFFDELKRLCSDDDLRRLLARSTAGRIHRRLLSNTGLETVRYLAGLVSENSHDCDAGTALQFIIEQIQTRIGNRPNAWLNSYGVIEQRLYGSLRIDAFEPLYTGPDDDIGASLSNIARADTNRVLHRSVLADRNGFANLLRRHPEAERIILSFLSTRMLIDPLEPGAVQSWHYFDPIIADDAHYDFCEANGIRPGDVFGAHRRKGGG